MLGFHRITFDPNVMGGRACIRGMRTTVALIVNLAANGMTQAEIIEAYPYLEPNDIKQALQFADSLLCKEEFCMSYSDFREPSINFY